MEALGLSSGAAGLVSLGLTVCHGLLDYYHSWKDAEDRVTQMYASIEALTMTFRLLESAIEAKVFSLDNVQRVEESIRSAEKGLQSLRKKLEKVSLVPLQTGWKAKGMAQFRRTLFPFKESTLAKLNELGIELRQDLKLALEVLQIESSGASLQKLDFLAHDLAKVSVNVDILQEQSNLISGDVRSIKASSQNTSTSVDDLLTAQGNDYYRKVYDWLSALTVEFEKKHLDTFNTPGRQDALAQSLVETTAFRLWLSGTGETLWCPGIRESDLISTYDPRWSLWQQYADTDRGYGQNCPCVSSSQRPGLIDYAKILKSSYIINHLQGVVDQTDTHVAYFYLSYKDTEKQNIPNLLMSLICQLAFSEPTLSAELIASYEDHGFGATCPSHVECKKLLKNSVDRCDRVFLIIDAFDEYPEEWRNQLVKELQDLQPKVNTMITSRDLPTIERQLSDVIRLDVQARSDDILGYVRERITSSERLTSHAERDPILCDLIATTIATRAKGM